MTTSTRQPRTRPQLSVNQFGQYLEANGRKRNTILRNQKFPNDVLILYYKEGIDAIVDYIGSNFDDDVFEEKSEEIGNKPTQTVRQASRLKDCLDALENFQNLAVDELEDMLDHVQIIPAPHNPPDGTVQIEGVDVSLRPEFFLKATDKNGNPIKGVVKLYVSKKNPLTDYTGKAIATLCLEYLENMSKPAGAPSRDLLLVIDVFAQTIHTAPKATARIRQDIEATCREISRLWPSVSKGD
jgi:hypothetical protein